MKQLFSIFFALALLLPVGIQAQLLDAVNDSPEGGYLFDENGQVSGRNNAPQAKTTRTHSYSWANDVSLNGITMMSGSNLGSSAYIVYTIQAFPSKNTNNRPALTLSVGFSTSSAYELNYGQVTTIKTGTYSYTNSTTWGNMPGKLVCNSGISAASNYRHSGSNKEYFTSGSVTFEAGRHGYPYIYCNSLTNSNYNYTFTVGDGRAFSETYTTVRVATDEENGKGVLWATNNTNTITLVFDLSSFDANIGIPAGTYTIGTNVRGGAFDEDGYTRWIFTSGSVTISKSGSSLSLSTSSLRGVSSGSTFNLSCTISNKTPNRTFTPVICTGGMLGGGTASPYFPFKVIGSTTDDGYQPYFHSPYSYLNDLLGNNGNGTGQTYAYWTSVDASNNKMIKPSGSTTFKQGIIVMNYSDRFLCGDLTTGIMGNDGTFYYVKIWTNQVSYSSGLAAFSIDDDRNATFGSVAYPATTPTDVDPSDNSAFIKARTGNYKTDLPFYVDPSKDGVIPTGRYEITSSRKPGTVLLGTNEGGYIYGAYCEDASYDYYLRCGIVDVFNLNETYYIHSDPNYNARGKTCTYTIGTAPKDVTLTTPAANGTAQIQFTATNWSNKVLTYVSGTAHKFFEGQTISLQATPASGYRVAYWTLGGVKINGSELQNTYSYTVGSAATQTLAAVLEAAAACTYEVAFNANGGSGTMPNQEFTCGEAQPLNPNAFTGPAATITYNYHGATSGNGTPSVTVNKPFGGWEDSVNDELHDDEEEVDFSVSNGATVTMTAQWNAFEPVTLPTPVRTGYTFNGWYTEETGGTKKGNGGASFNPAGSITLHAQWTANTHNVSITAPTNGTITVSYNDGGAQSFTSGSRSIAENTVLTVTTTPAADYHFSAWTGNGAASVTVDGVKTIGATFAQNDYFLNATYGAGGASVTRDDGGNNLTVKRAGNTVTLTPTAATGYNFLAWGGADAAKMSGNVFTFPTNGTHNTTYNVQATFQAITYNLSYDGLNGATNSNPDTYTIETATFALANPGTREGYTFTGWTCGGNAITQIALGSTGDKTITANWTLNSHQLTWDANDGSLEGGTAAGTTAYGTALTAPTATRTGYTFNGWDPSVPATMPDADATYTAQWNVNSYTLTWTTDGDALTGDYTSGSTAYGTTIAQPNTPTKTGYTFAGWDTDPAATMPAANTEYTATWNADSYTVTLDANGGNENKTTTATYNSSTLTSWIAPTKDEWTLQGYFTAASDGDMVIDADGELVADVSGYTDEDGKWIRAEGEMTLFAQWAESLNTDLVLTDGEENSYYDALAATYYGDGSNPVQLTSLTYQRTFNAKQWAAFSLPFDWYIEEESVLDGIVYRFTGATGNANDGVYVRFSGELDQNKLEAGKPYLINPTSDITSLTFTPNEENPTLQLSEYILDNDNNQVALYEDGGTESTVRFTATNRRYTLHGRYINEVENPDWKRYVFLNNNRLYYPNASGNTMRPFRGFFYVDGAGSSIAPRVHIVADGQVVTEIEMMKPDQTADEQSASEVRKYVENGILIIERNGVKYNAQGGRL